MIRATPLAGLTRRYVVALSVVGLLSVSAFLTFDRLGARHEQTLAVIEASGLLCVLSQRAALYASWVGEGRCPPAVTESGGCRQDLGRTIETLEQTLDAITQSTQALGEWEEDMPLVEVIQDLEHRLSGYVAALRTLMTATDPEEAQEPGMGLLREAALDRVLTEAAGALPHSLPVLIREIQRETRQENASLRRTQLAALVVTLLTLGLEALLIFRPMVWQVRQHVATLERVRADLEQTVRDRTRAIEEAREKAVRATHSKSRFLAAAGHDLMQPLRAATMLTGVIARHAETEGVRRAVPELRAAHQAMSRLVRAVIDLSRLDAGVVEPHIEPVDLGRLLDNTAAPFLHEASIKGLRLRVVKTSLWVATDPVLLERVLTNLLSNAVRYTARGGIVLGVRRRADGPVLVVVDTGPGIEGRDRTRIFEEFTRLSPGSDTPVDGEGLGLAIVDRLSRLLGFDVSLSSRVGRGTAFCVHIPADALVSSQTGGRQIRADRLFSP